MNPFWGGNLGQKWLKLVGGENFADKEKERPPLPEIQFRNSGEEKELKQVWDLYEHTMGEDKYNELYDEFVSLFVRTFENWRPPENLKYNEIYSSSQNDGMVHGCVFGHPTAVVISLVDALAKIVHQFEENSNERQDSQDGLDYLHALVVVTRSHHNRQIVAENDGFASLMRLMKGAVLRLKRVVLIVTSDRRASLSNFTQLSYLQCLLAHVVSVISNFIEAEVQEVESKGKRQEPAATIVVGPAGEEFVSSVTLLESGGLSSFAELLKLLRVLHDKGNITDVSLECLAVSTLLSALSAEDIVKLKLKKQLRTVGLIETLVSGLGWPPPHLAGIVGEPLDSSVYEEFNRQLLVLRLIRESVYLDPSNLQQLSDLQGFSKFSTLLRWVSWIFSDAGAKNDAYQDPYKPSVTVPKPSAIGMSAEEELRAWNQQCYDVCRLLISFLQEPTSQNSGILGLSYLDPQSSPPGSLVYWELCTQKIIGTFMDAFREGRTAEPVDNVQEVVSFYRSGTCCLQSYILYTLRQFLVASPSILQIFRDNGVWETLFSPSFFYHGLKDPAPPKPSLSAQASRGDPPYRQSIPNMGTSQLSFSSRPSSASSLLLNEKDTTPSSPAASGRLSWRSSSTPSSSASSESKNLVQSSRRGAHMPMSDRSLDFSLPLPPRPGDSTQTRSGSSRRRGHTSTSSTSNSTPSVSAIPTNTRTQREKVASQPALPSSLPLAIESSQLTELPSTREAESLRLEVVSLLEAAATQDHAEDNKPELSTLLEAIQRCALVPTVAASLVRCLHRILDLLPEQTVEALLELEAAAKFGKVMQLQQQGYQAGVAREQELGNQMETASSPGGKIVTAKETWWVSRSALFSLFEDYLATSEAARSNTASNWTIFSALFAQVEDSQARKFALKAIVMLLKAPTKSRFSNVGLFENYVQTIVEFGEKGSSGVSVLEDLLACVREVVNCDPKNQGSFVDAGCLEKLVTLLSGEFSPPAASSSLCIQIVETIRKLLTDNKLGKERFRGMPSVGVGYKHLVQPLISCYCLPPDGKLLKALLNVLVDSDFDLANNPTIENEDAISLFMNVIRKCHLPLQLEYLATFERLLADSTSNCAACVRAGLMELLLQWLAQEDNSHLQASVSLLIQMVGNHSLSGKNLRSVFSLLRSTKEGKRPRHGGRLLRTLQGMVKEDGPTVFFELNGKNSGIQVVSPMKLPVSRGFSFCCWFRVEAYPAPSNFDGPFAGSMGLFKFATEQGKGYTALIQESQIVIQISGMKDQVITVEWPFYPKRWYHIGMTHSVGQMLSGASFLKVYVDGKGVESVRAGYPKILEPLSRCDFATAVEFPALPDGSYILNYSPNGPVRALSAAFRGQLGPIYVFEDVVTGTQMEGIYLLGPSYMYSFSGSEFSQLPQLLTAHNLTDTKEGVGLSSKIMASYNAQASEGQIIFDTKPFADQSWEQGVHDAHILSGVQLCYRQRIQDSIHCVGGIGVLFPLFIQLDLPVQSLKGDEELEEQSTGKGRVKETKDQLNVQFALDVIGMLTAILAGSRASQQYMLNISGFACLGFLLQRVAPQHLGVDFILALENLLISIANTPDSSLGDALVKEVVTRLFLNPKIWIFTPFIVQKELYSTLLRYADKDPRRMRSLCGLLPILDLLRQYYWDKPQSLTPFHFGMKPLLHPVTGTVLGERPSLVDVAMLRKIVLKLPEKMIKEEFEANEVKGFVAFLETSKDPAIVEEVLTFMMELLTKKSRLASFEQHVYTLGGCQVFLGLLEKEQESIRVLGLRLIGIVLLATPNEKRTGMEPPSGHPLTSQERSWLEKMALAPLFAAIEEAIKNKPLSDVIWATLFDLLTGSTVNREVLTQRQPMRRGGGRADVRLARAAATSEAFFFLPQVVQIILNLLGDCAGKRAEVLGTLIRMLEESPANKEVLAKEPFWQVWMLDLLSRVKEGQSDFSDTESMDGFAGETERDPEEMAVRAVEESLIMKIFVLVHVHAILNLKAGWHPLERTVVFVNILGEQLGFPVEVMLRTMLADVLEAVLKENPSQFLLLTQPCRDNCLFVLSLVDEVAAIDCAKYLTDLGDSLGSEFDYNPGPSLLSSAAASPARFFGQGNASPARQFNQGNASPMRHFGHGSSRSLEEVAMGLENFLQESGSNPGSQTPARKLYNKRYDFSRVQALIARIKDNEETRNSMWRLYSVFWEYFSVINGIVEDPPVLVDSEVPGNPAHPGVGPNPSLGSGQSPTLGQRAMGLVESFNMQALELIGVSSRPTLSQGIEKAVRMRGERCPRLVFRLMLLFMQEADMDLAVLQMDRFLAFLPSMVSVETEQARNRLHLFLWNLNSARHKFSISDKADRILLVSQLIQGSIEKGRPLLMSNSADATDSEDTSVAALERLVQPDRAIQAMKESSKQLLQSTKDRNEDIKIVKDELENWENTESEQECVLKEKRQASVAEICSAESTRRQGERLKQRSEQQAVASQWLKLYRDLTGERGSWSSGRSENESPIYWKLDKMEDPYRRRPRMRPNYRFDPKLQLPPDEERTGWKSRKMIESLEDKGEGEGDQMPFFMKALRSSSSVSGITELETSSTIGSEAGEKEEVAEDTDNEEKGEDGEEAEGEDSEIASSQKEIAVEDKILSSAPCVFVSAKRKLAGRIEVKQKRLLFYGEYTVEGNGGSSVFDEEGNLRPKEEIPSRTGGLGSNGPPGNLGEVPAGNVSLKPEERARRHKEGDVTSKMLSTGAILPSQLKIQKDTDFLHDVKEFRKWSLHQIKQVRITRYLLQFSALEIFFVGSHSPIFLNFASPAAAKDVANRLGQAANTAAKAMDKDREVTIVDKKRAIELAERAKNHWKYRLISNFEYLMTLNTLAGRSYNDIMQYPVFPWVVADYKSEELDFRNPKTFRDLSKPVGALDEKRLESFQERYLSFQDPDIPSFFYGSHYSTAAIVLFYLIRLEPFSKLNRSLQGGKFDHADRMFHSVESTWSNCLTNTSDVKELVPEFYYLPEFLRNHNDYYLGQKQDGTFLADVVLPPWAKGSPEVFVHKCREALESEYVSDHLNDWIDLIFGFKQRGVHAVEACNVFYHLTYEGAVSLENITDPFERAAVEDQIANYGQVPLQLFRKPHCKRNPPSAISRPLRYSPSAITRTSTIKPHEGHSPYSALRGGKDPDAIVYVGLAENKAVCLNRGQLMNVRYWMSPSTGGFNFAGGGEGYCGFGDTIFSRRVGTPFSGMLDVHPNCFAVFQAASTVFLLTCGHWDNSFQCISVSDGKTIRSIRLHNDVVTCLSVSSDGTTVVTGSKDTTVMVWQVNLVGGGPTRAFYTERQYIDNVISDKPLAVLCGHDDVVLCVSVKSELDLVVSGSKDGTCILHTLNQGRYLRTLHHPKGKSIDRLAVSVNGHIILYSHDDFILHCFSINGNHLASVETGSRINCMSLSADNDFLVTGGANGNIVVRLSRSLVEVRQYDGTGMPVTGLAVTREDTFIAGLEDGYLLVYSVESNQVKKQNTNFYSIR